MIAQMYALTHSMPLGNLFGKDQDVKTFESDVTLCEIFDSFTHYGHDIVLITENSVHIGIVTLKDMMRILQDFENLFCPVREFMNSPLLMFESTQTIADVLDSVPDHSSRKIVVKNDTHVIGVIDVNELISLCYTKIRPLIKHDNSVWGWWMRAVKSL